ncbi:acyltransferase [Clostridium cylindrosporum]|uniref:Acyltransferase n=1 Tax=Clostridium cylindrosporum DSM 605 TaxID=1121307 RepID=A0A0J8D4U0_CLOCY|nr:acyltransferase [Clostridium cylindrosporum]KMT21180.1 acyltransferase [Clostridium cylindrosporum DSM 605]
MGKKRIYEVDILRGIAFLAVVLQHSLAGFIYDSNLKVYESITSSLLLNIIRFAVPLFVVMTGFSLYYSDKGNGYLEFIKKRFNQIILPYLLWTVVYDLFMFLITGMKVKGLYDTLIEYLKYVFTGTASYHLWYMVMIIQFYLIYPIFKKLINKNNTKKINTLVLVAFFVIHVGLLYWYNFYSGGLYESLTGLLKDVLAYRDRLFIMWMFYFVIGAYFAIYFDDIRCLLWKIRYITTALFIFSLTYVMMNMVESGSFNQSGGYTINHFLGSPLNTLMFPLLFFSILILYPLAEYVLKKHEGLGGRLIKVGKYSFGAYLVHPLVLHYDNIIIKAFIPWFYIRILLSFVICSILSIWIAKLLQVGRKNIDLRLASGKKVKTEK